MKKMIRTEEEILNDFKKMGYEVSSSNMEVTLTLNFSYEIRISKWSRTYRVAHKSLSGCYIAQCGMKEHKLLHELFLCWGWLDEKED